MAHLASSDTTILGLEDHEEHTSNLWNNQSGENLVKVTSFLHSNNEQHSATKVSAGLKEQEQVINKSSNNNKKNCKKTKVFAFSLIICFQTFC